MMLRQGTSQDEGLWACSLKLGREHRFEKADKIVARYTVISCVFIGKDQPMTSSLPSGTMIQPLIFSSLGRQSEN